MATNRTPSEQDMYAVVRLDSFRNFTPRPENVTVRRVVHHYAEAELEVRHLNMTAPTGTVYFIQRTTVAPRIGPAAGTAELVLPPHQRSHVEKKSARNEKSKRK
jgi:hypothetical protein